MYIQCPFHHISTCVHNNTHILNWGRIAHHNNYAYHITSTIHYLKQYSDLAFSMLACLQVVLITTHIVCKMCDPIDHIREYSVGVALQ